MAGSNYLITAIRQFDTIFSQPRFHSPFAVDKTRNLNDTSTSRKNEPAVHSQIPNSHLYLPGKHNE